MEPQVELVVRVGGASAKGMEQALAGIPGVQAGGSMQVVTLPKGQAGLCIGPRSNSGMQWSCSPCRA